jgi:hypothetical protein
MKTFRKWNRIIHRDFGYFFFSMTIIYAVSGIAINHVDDWNPNYIIEEREFDVTNRNLTDISKEEVLAILDENNIPNKYKSHYYRRSNQLKVFLKNGQLIINPETGAAYYESQTRRPFFYQFNKLHYNPSKGWTWFSDIYAGALFLLAISGLILLKGKNGFKKRGWYFVLAGTIIPIIFMILLDLF